MCSKCAGSHDITAPGVHGRWVIANFRQGTFIHMEHSPQLSRGKRSRAALLTLATSALLAGGVVGAGQASADPALPSLPEISNDLANLPASKDLINDNRTIADDELVRPVASHAVLGRDASVPIVVLGARLNEDCNPPEVLDDRLNGAATLANIHRANPIVVTGGATQPGCPSEAAAMEAGLKARGVTNPIITEEESGSTVENVANTSDYINSTGGLAVVVTSDPHYSRALDNYRSSGIEAVAYVEGEG